MALLFLSSALVAATLEVKIRDSRFEPDTVRIHPGDTVRWTHEDAMVHTVTAPGDWDSGEMQFGDTYSRVFPLPGRHPYVCLYHPMFGIVQVGTPVALNPAASPEAPASKAPARPRDIKGRVLP